MINLRELASKNDIPFDQVLILICYILVFLLSFAYKHIKSPINRHLYSIILGPFIHYMLFGYRMIDIVLTNLFCIIMIYVLPRKYVGKVVNAFISVHLFYIHYDRMMKDNGTWNMEISFTYMMTLPKWSSFSFNYSDGEDKLNKNSYKINEYRIVDFIGYIYFLPSCITGPFSEYNDYIDFINKKNNYESIKYDYIHVLKK